MRTPLFETFVRDVRVALRALLKSPGFAGVVVISLALGIAANSTIYSVLNAELFRPLPYRDSNRLVAMWQTEQARPDDRQAPPIAENVDWNKQTHVFEDIALTSERDDVAVAGLGEPRTLRTQYVSPDFFEVLGARPILGRVFEAGEAQDWSQTVVISEEFWNREFHRDPGVLGKSFSLEEVVSTVPRRWKIITEPLSFVRSYPLKTCTTSRHRWTLHLPMPSWRKLVSCLPQGLK